MIKKGIILGLALIAGFAARWYVDNRAPSEASSNPGGAAANQVALPTLKTGDTRFEIIDPKDSRLRVIYFGFTHCPDVCPTSLAVLAAAIQTMDEAERQQFVPLFVTLDPERDTPEKSAEYAGFFNPSIIGASAGIEGTKQLGEHFGVLYQKSTLENSAMAYSIDHSSFFYLVDAKGELQDKVPHSMNPAILVDAIRQLITSQTPELLTN